MLSFAFGSLKKKNISKKIHLNEDFDTVKGEGNVHIKFHEGPEKMRLFVSESSHSEED